jgi:hypothetical protein
LPRYTQELKSKLYRSLSVSEFEHFAENINALHDGLTWIRSYLARPHPQLGRQGAVCPFAQTALDYDTIRIAVVRLRSDNKRAEILDAIKYHLAAFVSAPGPSDEQVFHATLILFPDVSLEEAPDLIDRIKEELKPSFVQQGLMLGEFHRHNESPGLHNPDFKPLRSPIPILAIRRMVSTDFVFLNRSEYDDPTRLNYLKAYLAAPGIPEFSRQEVERAAASLRAKLQSDAPQN